MAKKLVNSIITLLPFFPPQTLCLFWTLEARIAQLEATATEEVPPQSTRTMSTGTQTVDIQSESKNQTNQKPKNGSTVPQDNN